LACATRGRTGSRDGVTLGVGIMARAPSSGGKTRLAAHLPEARLRTLRAALLADTLQTISAVPDVERVVFVTPADRGAEIRGLSAAPLPCVAQTGADLGGRMCAALEYLLHARGCEAAILVGTDMPLLTAAHINEARDTLDTFRGVVLGPADDGGYYLIGMQEVHPELFQGVEWGTASVLNGTLGAADRIGLEARLIRAGYDVDTIEDLRRLERDLRKAPSDLAPRLRIWYYGG
jgi:hypothetical protein